MADIRHSMKDPRFINIADFEYTLPEDRIAAFPLANRDESKLLVYRNREISTGRFAELDKILPSDSLLVLNNTRVIHARLLFRKETGSQIEILLLTPVHPAEHQQALSCTQTCEWECMVGNIKRWKKEDVLKLELSGQIAGLLYAELKSRDGDHFKVGFSWEPSDLSFAEILDHAGVLPLPPYLNRKSTGTDEDRYQTIFALQSGSVAAPTAGLHFTPELLKRLQQNNIRQTSITLHVGAGTFKPVKSDVLKNHAMHEEHLLFPISSVEAIHHALEHRKPIIAVGTTVTRSLESLYWYGVRLIEGRNDAFHISQWEPYDKERQDIDAFSAIEAVLKHMRDIRSNRLAGSTSIICTPGYVFRMVDVLITNFHQPGNTLILLIAAFAGDDWRRIYDYALMNDFRFLSYGDSSVLFRSFS